MTDFVVSSGQTSTGLVINSGDTLTVLSGGTASATTVNSGGLETVSPGGMDFSATIADGGEMVNQGTVTGVTLNSLLQNFGCRQQYRDQGGWLRGPRH